MDAETAEEKRIARAVARQGRGVVRVSPRPAQPVAVKKVGGQQQQQREAVTKRAVVAQPVSTTTTTAVRKTGVRRHGLQSEGEESLEYDKIGNVSRNSFSGIEKEWVSLQYKAFMRWTNYHLQFREHSISKFETDLCDGLILRQLLEILSKKEIRGICKNPRIRVQKVSNLWICFSFIDSEKILLENMGPEDIADSNLKLILGLIWTLILHYQVHVIRDRLMNLGGGKEIGDGKKADSSQPNKGKKKPVDTRQLLIDWVANYVKDPPYSLQVSDIDAASLRDGLVLCAIVGKTEPRCLDFQKLDKSKGDENLKKGFFLLQNVLHAPALIDPSDIMKSDKLDNKALIAFISGIVDKVQSYQGDVSGGEIESLSTAAEAFANPQKHDHPSPKSSASAASPSPSSTSASPSASTSSSLPKCLNCGANIQGKAFCIECGKRSHLSRSPSQQKIAGGPPKDRVVQPSIPSSDSLPLLGKGETPCRGDSGRRQPVPTSSAMEKEQADKEEARLGRLVRSGSYIPKISPRLSKEISPRPSKENISKPQPKQGEGSQAGSKHPGDDLDAMLGELDDLGGRPQQAKAGAIQPGSQSATKRPGDNLDAMLGELDDLGGRPQQAKARTIQPSGSEGAPPTSQSGSKHPGDNLDAMLGELDDLGGRPQQAKAGAIQPGSQSATKRPGADLDAMLGELDDLGGRPQQAKAGAIQPFGSEGARAPPTSQSGSMRPGDDLDAMLGELDDLGGRPQQAKAGTIQPSGSEGARAPPTSQSGSKRPGDDLDAMLGELDDLGGRPQQAKAGTIQPSGLQGTRTGAVPTPESHSGMKRPGDDLDDMLGDLEEAAGRPISKGRSTEPQGARAGVIPGPAGQSSAKKPGDDLDDMLGDLEEAAAGRPISKGRLAEPQGARAGVAPGPASQSSAKKPGDDLDDMLGDLEEAAAGTPLAGQPQGLQKARSGVIPGPGSHSGSKDVPLGGEGVGPILYKLENEVGPVLLSKLGPESKNVSPDLISSLIAAIVQQVLQVSPYIEDDVKRGNVCDKAQELMKSGFNFGNTLRKYNQDPSPQNDRALAQANAMVLVAFEDLLEALRDCLSDNAPKKSGFQGMGMGFSEPPKAAAGYRDAGHAPSSGEIHPGHSGGSQPSDRGYHGGAPPSQKKGSLTPEQKQALESFPQSVDEVSGALEPVARKQQPDIPRIATAFSKFLALAAKLIEALEQSEDENERAIGKKMRQLYEKIKGPILDFLRRLKSGQSSPDILAQDALKIVQILKVFFEQFRDGLRQLNERGDGHSHSHSPSSSSSFDGNVAAAPGRHADGRHGDGPGGRHAGGDMGGRHGAGQGGVGGAAGGVSSVLHGEDPVTELAEDVDKIANAIVDLKHDPHPSNEKFDNLLVLFKKILKLIRAILENLNDQGREKMAPFVDSFVAKLSELHRSQDSPAVKKIMLFGCVKALAELNQALKEALAASAPLCVACNAPISGSYFDCQGEKYHSHCFRSQAPLCGACHLPLEGDAWAVGDQQFHEKCLYCEVCNKGPLTSCIVSGDKILCEEHAGQAEGVVSCRGCGKEIDGECLMVNEDYFHERCLVCCRCQQQLQGMEFYHVENGLMCDPCLQKS